MTTATRTLDTTTVSASRYAWECLGAPVWEPPPKWATDDARCWLCGGTIQETAWHRHHFPATFTNVNLARVPASQAVCQPCAYLSAGASWPAEAARLGLKSKHPISWRSYDHLFQRDLPGGHIVPSRAGWRGLLLAPPAPPFVAVITESGQKHLLFRAAVAYDRDRFRLQLEEDTLVVNRAACAACLAAFEALYRLGFGKQEIASGHYRQHQILAVGLAAWRAAESAFAPERQQHPELVRLAAYVARKES